MTETTTSALAMPGGALVSREDAGRTAHHMAKEYREATAEIGRLLQAVNEQTKRLAEAFPSDYSPFDISYEYNGHRHYRIDEHALAETFAEMKRRAWRVLVDHLGIKNIMSVAKRKEFEQQLERGDLPDIKEETILGLCFGLADQAKDFAAEAAKEVFAILRPSSGTYKTNDPFRVGRRVILHGYVERKWDGKSFRVNHYRHQEVTAIDGVFHVLDGKGVMRENRGPLSVAIEASPNGQGGTDYFRFKCFKNRNLHLEMRRLDLVRQLNGLAAGEYVLGNDMME
jgi:hypothetical protein